MAQAQRLVPRVSRFPELADDQGISRALDPRLLLGGLISLQAHQVFFGNRESAGFGLDLYADTVEQGLSPRELDLHLQVEIGTVLLEEPFQSFLGKAERFQGITTKRGLQGRGERLLGRKPGEQKERLQKIALARRIGSYQDHQRRELDVDVIQGFESLD